jgi:hypothetical protein
MRTNFKQTKKTSWINKNQLYDNEKIKKGKEEEEVQLLSKQFAKKREKKEEKKSISERIVPIRWVVVREQFHEIRRQVLRWGGVKGVIRINTDIGLLDN